MEQTFQDSGTLSPNWAEVVRHYSEIMDEVMPYLSPAEQVVYHRLFRLSHARGLDFTTCRYLDLAEQCRLSLSTLQRALKERNSLKPSGIATALRPSMCSSSQPFRTGRPFYLAGAATSYPPLLQRGLSIHQCMTLSVPRIGSFFLLVSAL